MPSFTYVLNCACDCHVESCNASGEERRRIGEREREGERDVRCASKEGQMHRVISKMYGEEQMVVKMKKSCSNALHPIATHPRL